MRNEDEDEEEEEEEVVMVEEEEEEKEEKEETGEEEGLVVASQPRYGSGNRFRPIPTQQQCKQCGAPAASYVKKSNRKVYFKPLCSACRRENVGSFGANRPDPTLGQESDINDAFSAITRSDQDGYWDYHVKGGSSDASSSEFS